MIILKFKRFFIFGLLLLTIVTIGAVSASENLTASDFSEDSALESSVEEIDLSAGDEDVIAGNQKFSDEDITVDAPSEVKAGENNEITVSLPEDTTGYIIKKVVAFEEEDYDEYVDYYEYDVYDGISHVPLSFGSLNSYTINLTYSGDNIYDKQVIWTKTYDVKDFEMSVYEDYVNFGEDASIYVNLPNFVEGTLTLNINGKTYTKEIYGGDEEFIVPDLKLGENPFTVNFDSDKYSSKSAEGRISVAPQIIVPYVIEYNQNTVISLNLPANAVGNLIVNFNNKEYTRKLVNGKASIKIPSNLELGYYDFEAYYDGIDYDVPEYQDQLEVVPYIFVPKTVWIEDMGNIIIEVPQPRGPILDIEINEADYKTIYIYETKTTIPLADLELDAYRNEIYLRYIDGDEFHYYSHGFNFEVEIRENSPNLDLDIDVSESIMPGESLYISMDLPDVYENLLVYIDGVLYEVEDYNFENIDTSKLALGNHTIEFVLKNDEYYKDTSKTFSFEVGEVLIDIPDQIIIGDDSVEVKTAKNLRGNITIFVDGNKYKMMPILPGYSDYEYGHHFYFELDDLTIGKHNIKVVYSGDGNHKPIEKSADVNVSYTILCDIGLDDEFNIYYGSEDVMYVYLPVDATKDISVKIDGNSFNNIIGDEYFYYRTISLDISNLNIGLHTIEISYPGDEKYGPLKFSRNFNVTSLISIEDYSIFMGESTYVSLKLPEDANGKLVVIVDDDKRYTKSLNNGFAKVSLYNLPMGDREIFAYYTGSDYEVESKTFDLYVGRQYVFTPYDLEELGYFYLKMPDDANGNLIVILDGKQYKKQKLVNGEANITIEPRFGNHYFEFLYDGDDYEFSYETDWTLSPVWFLNWVIFDGESVELMSLKDANGKFSASVNGKEYDLNFVEGHANFTPTNLHFGDNEVHIKYIGDDYGTYECLEDVWLQPTVYVGHDDDYMKMSWDKLNGWGLMNRNVSSSDYMIINLDNDFDAKYAIIIDDDLYANGKFVNGVANISLSKLKLGFKRINLVYEYAENNYNYMYLFANIKKSPEISVTANNVYEGQNVKITVNAAKDISDNVVVTVNNKNYTKKMSNGKTSLNVPDLAVGSYSISVKYLGDKNFVGDNAKTTVNVLPKRSPNLSVTASNIQQGQSAVIEVAADSNVNGNVLVNVNNANYTVKLVEGQGSLNVNNLKPNSYIVHATFMGDDKFVKETANKTFKVTYIPKITAKATSVLYSAKGKYSVTVYGANGKVASGVNVVFKIAGKKVATVKTNSRGVSSFIVTQKPGNYKVSAIALGKTVTKTLKVKHLLSLKSVTVKKSAKKLVLTATLSKVNKKYLNKKKITFKFNGKKFTAKTNKKGVAKVTIKKTVLKKLKVGKKITYQATYLKDTVKKSVKVKK